jgi:hypothetical protein
MNSYTKHMFSITSVFFTSLLIAFLLTSCGEKNKNSYSIDGVKLEKFSEAKDYFSHNSWEEVELGIAYYIKNNMKLIVRYAPTGTGAIDAIYISPEDLDVKKQYSSYIDIDSLNLKLSKDGWSELNGGIKVFEKTESINKDGKPYYQQRIAIIEYSPKDDAVTSVIQSK